MANGFNILANFKSPRNWFRNDKTPRKEPNKYRLSENALKLISIAYEHRSILDQHLSSIHKKEDFIDKMNQEDFQNDVVKPFHKELGIIDGSYAIVDDKQDAILVIRSQQNNPYIPIYPIFPNGYFGHEEESLSNQRLIDFMYESDKEILSLSVAQDYKAPYFLQNLPPHQSKYAFPPLPFEQKLRKKEEINYLYCYTGEVLFYTYAWRWLIKYAQFAGFESTVDLKRSKIPYKAFQDKFWSKEYWNIFFKDIPELKWLKFIDRKTENRDKKEYRQYWNIINQKLDGASPDDYDFQANEWKNLGLTSTNPVLEQVMYALKSYGRHVLRNLEIENTSIDELERLKKKKLNIATEETKEKILAINKSIDEILLLSDKARKQAAINRFFKQNEYATEDCHYILRKIIFELLAARVPKPKSQIQIADLLKQLHKISRFPLMSTYYQVALSAQKLPVEYYFFPISKSYKYRFNANLPTKNKREKNSNVVIAGICLKPIWAIDDKFTMTKDGNYYTDEDRAESFISDEAFARLRIIQDYFRQVSGPLVDTAFYGGIVRKEVEVAAKENQYFFQTHEIRRLIICIKEDTPQHILKEIRSYFSLIFGSKWFIINSFFEDKNDEYKLPKEFDPGNTYYELISNAAILACKIHCIVALAESGEIHRCSEESFDNRVAAISEHIDIKIDKGERHQYYNYNQNDKEDAAIFYFMAAVVCGLRNALKHRDDEYPVFVEKEKNTIEIVNYKEVEPLALSTNEKAQIRKPNLGSTAISLKYYVSEYTTFDERAIMKELDSDKYKTIIPIPKN